jgi:molybdenum cofactor synthesis domain-containing protein
VDPKVTGDAAAGRPERGASASRPGGARPGRRALVVTVSDGVAAGTRSDSSGDGLQRRLEEIGLTVDRAVVPDEVVAIQRLLAEGAAHHDLVLTTGGTGLTPRDVTPQATHAIVEYEVPGLPELMRAQGGRSTPYAYLSRGVAGVLERCLIVNLPGSPNGALESLAALEPILDHALATLAGPFDHDRQLGQTEPGPSRPDGAGTHP